MRPSVIVISSSNSLPSEIKKVIELFKSGLKQFHIRKPDFSDFDMMAYITSVPKEYRKYLVLHSHYHLAKEFDLKGIQVGINRVKEAEFYKADFKYFGYSAHSLSELEDNKDKYSHFFLSPIFNSISKSDYKAKFSKEELRRFLQKNQSLNIMALGGVDSSNYQDCLNLGFSGVALLGAIWQQNESFLAFNKIQNPLLSRPYVLSIAGFDPSSGAGITADIKTFEQHGVYGLGISTAITYQHESKFISVDWLSFNQIEKQLNVLFEKYSPDYVKIGLIENFEVLKQIITLLKSYDAEIKIIWDPILKASAHFDFHHSIKQQDVYDLLKNVYLVTPNLPETKALFNSDNIEDVQQIIRSLVLAKVLVKGGHSNNDDVTDVLIEPNSIIKFEGQRIPNVDKHGTGCVLSSAICSNLALGMDLQASINHAKQYLTAFMGSNSGLLGYHNIKNNEDENI